MAPQAWRRRRVEILNPMDVMAAWSAVAEVASDEIDSNSGSDAARRTAATGPPTVVALAWALGRAAV